MQSSPGEIRASRVLKDFRAAHGDKLAGSTVRHPMFEPNVFRNASQGLTFQPVAGRGEDDDSL